MDLLLEMRVKRNALLKQYATFDALSCTNLV